MSLPDEKLLKECATWIYKHKHEGFWTPYTITALNVDAPDNPHVTTDQAFWVFTELARRRLMVHKIFKTSDRKLFPAFGFNFNKEKEWNKLVEKSGLWKLRVVPWGWWLLKKSWLVLLFMVGIILNNVLSEYTKYYVKKRLDKPQAIQSISPLTNTPTSKP